MNIEVARDRRCPGKRQTRHDGQNGGKRDRREETEHQVTAHGMCKVHRHHVSAAQQLAIDVASLEEPQVLADNDNGRQPRISSTLKKYPMKPLAYSTDFLASFASLTVKNRIRI